MDFPLENFNILLHVWRFFEEEINSIINEFFFFIYKICNVSLKLISFIFIYILIRSLMKKLDQLRILFYIKI